MLEPRVILVEGVQRPLGIHQLVLLDSGSLLDFQLAQVVDDPVSLPLGLRHLVVRLRPGPFQQLVALLIKAV